MMRNVITQNSTFLISLLNISDQKAEIFVDPLAEMAENSIKILMEAHNEDLRIANSNEETTKNVKERPKNLEENLKCKLKRSTKLLWGQENCDIK